tara:strand:- start:411 stop:629 length:219 start_codon:yes stop_codon:yes gene_type:complete
MMTVEEYIAAIKSAATSHEVVKLWSQAAAERHLSISDIINVHRSCGRIVTEAALDIRDNGSEESLKFHMKMK